MKLSVAIIAMNEEGIIGKTLNAVKNIADEIIVVDSHSTDKTVEIAEAMGAKVFVEDWKGDGLQKQSAMDKCQGEWILYLDADEVVSEGLANKIVDIIHNEKEKKIFTINFQGVCFGKILNHGGWDSSYHIRLIKRGYAYWNANYVHPEFVTDEKIYKIKEKIYHYTYDSLEDYFNKFNSYTTQAAIQLYNERRKAGVVKIILDPIYKFIRNYIFRLGFLDGKEGFVLAASQALYTMAKYYKLYEIYENKMYIDNKNM